nr:dual specificity protein phosphatase 14 [Hymenolepis microstoma]
MTGLSYYIPTASAIEWNGSRPITCNHQQCQHINQDIFSQIARINDHLYLCSLQALTSKRLHQKGITQVISVMPETIPSEILAQVERHIQIPVDDIDYSNLRSHFDEVGDRIAREARRGGKTAVHCMAGISRSATIVLAYLMKYQRLNLSEAYNRVISVRPCIQPNLGFWRQLIAYEESLYGYRTMRINEDGCLEFAFAPATPRDQLYSQTSNKHRWRGRRF